MKKLDRIARVPQQLEKSDRCDIEEVKLVVAARQPRTSIQRSAHLSSE